MPRMDVREHRNYFPRRELYEHVALTAAHSVAVGLPGLGAWGSASLRKRARTIYDINGRPLFLDYPIVRGRQVVGTVRAAASKVLGKPVISQIVGKPQWDYGKAVADLTPKVQREHPGWRIGPARLVCYSYPKLGVMFSLTDPRGRSQRLIFDVADGRSIPEGDPAKGREGAVAWSFYGALDQDEREKRLERQHKIDEAQLQVASNLREILQQEVRFTQLVREVKVMPFEQTVTRELQFCPHYAYNEARSHHCFVLHGQQVNDYCAVATCQMILCYYRYYYSQDDIAPALNYSSGSGCPADQSAGYESLSNNHIDATYDSTADWEEARSELQKLHPLKSGVTGHARAVAGYAYTRTFFPWGMTDKKLYVYDPWPWNADYKLAGEVYWEDWDSIFHTNFIYTKLDY